MIFIDGLKSFLTKLGTKINARSYAGAEEIQSQELLNMYRSSAMVKKFIDKTAEDMTKKWRNLESDDFDSEELKQFRAKEKELGVKVKAEDALIWSALLGDVLVFAVTNVDDELLGNELSLDHEEIIQFLVFDRQSFELGKEVEKDKKSKHFGKPIHYEIKVEGTARLKIHHTRAHRIMAGKRAFSERNKQGISDLQAAYKNIIALDTTILSISDLVEEAKIDIYSLKGLNDQISSGQGEQVQAYMSLLNMVKSNSNAIVIDTDDKHEQKEMSFSGLSQIVTQLMSVVAGALDRPLTVLFGQSASGFSTGEEDSQNYYDTINSLQESRLRPLLDFMDQFIFDALSMAPKELSYKFPTLNESSNSEVATIFNVYAQAFSILVESGLITDEMALKEIKQLGIMKNITEEDINISKTYARSNPETPSPAWT